MNVVWLANQTQSGLKSGECIEVLFIPHGNFNMTTPLKFVFYLTSLFLGKMANMNDLKKPTSGHEMGGFISATIGDNLTLKCFYDSETARYYWFKQTLEQKIQLISITYKYDENGTFYNEFKDNERFTLHTELGKNHLNIKNLQNSDSGTYYCASGISFMFEFVEGTVVSVQGSGLNIPAQVHQSASESIQPGGSVTLGCTVHTGTCDGEHRVYWFKHSGQAHPGLIYTHGGSNDQCERKPETQTHSCVYNLPMNSLNVSDAGTYYCAVASCGSVLFGNGTRLNVEDQVDCSFQVYFWTGFSAFTTLLSVLLAACLYIISRKQSCPCTEYQARLSSSSKTNVKGYQKGENLYYVALRETEINTRKQRDDTWSECVYFSVKLQN
uniref:Immunoglobulin kappa light chain-like n=2 Tax=Mastacembelus armatus TaxID=205130 RepID=A0A3Q3L445_9TELE